MVISKAAAGAVPAKKKTVKKESTSTVKKGNVLTVQGKPGNVAEYLMGQINLSGKSQAEIAREVGFAMPNMITMLKKNLTKLPIDKVGKMSKALGIDPVHLYKMCMSEYYPDTWVVVQGFLSQPLLTANELELIEVVRQSNVINPKVRTEAERHKLLDFVNALSCEEGQ